MRVRVTMASVAISGPIALILGVMPFPLANDGGETRFNFEKALLNVTRLGLTFGGGCSFGHGIRIRGGTARLVLTEYAIR